MQSDKTQTTTQDGIRINYHGASSGDLYCPPIDPWWSVNFDGLFLWLPENISREDVLKKAKTLREAIAKSGFRL